MAYLIAVLTISAKAAPSFSCSGRLTLNERMICKSTDLSRLDREISETFYELTSLLNRGAADLIRADQRAFLKKRQNCRNKFRCARLVMEARLSELKTDLEQQRSYREGNGNEEQEIDNPCGSGFTLVGEKCINNVDLEIEKIIGDTRPLQSGKYGIYVLSHKTSLRLDVTADKLLYTQNKSGNRNAPKQSYFVIYQNGAYSITDEQSGLRLHADGGGDKQVSVRYQPRDDFTKFRLTAAQDGCYFVQTVATNNYWVWEPNSQVIIVRPEPTGEESIFCFLAQ